MRSFVEFSVRDGAFVLGRVTALFSLSPFVGASWRGHGNIYDVAPDGRFLMARPREREEESPGSVWVVQNFYEELRRRVPN